MGFGISIRLNESFFRKIARTTRKNVQEVMFGIGVPNRAGKERKSSAIVTNVPKGSKRREDATFWPAQERLTQSSFQGLARLRNVGKPFFKKGVKMKSPIGWKKKRHSTNVSGDSSVGPQSGQITEV